MLTDAIRLLLFPALIAFAASSDLLTMTISNRLSLALAGGFVALAALNGLSLHDIAMHIGAGALPLNRAALLGWIANPQGAKPGVRMPPSSLPPEDLRALAGWLETLR